EDFLLAEEKGYNTYTKVEDVKCVAAQNWWKEKKEFWSIVRTKWEKELSNKNLKLRTEVYGEPLHMHLAKLNSKANKEDINKVIDRFIDFSEY
ncbi:MAG: DUF6607 family protein, partial [Solirubrobacteraceae bacterium]